MEPLMKIPIPPELTIADPAYNPAFDIPQYEWKTVSQWKSELTKDWHVKHAKADALIVNQNGTPLFALYKSPEADHNEMVHSLFRQLRANKFNEWEDEDV